MSERNFSPDDSSFSHSNGAPHNSVPQAIPRAGLGIVPADSHDAFMGTESTPDAATIPESAPLAPPLISSRALDDLSPEELQREIQLDEFDRAAFNDIDADAAPNGAALAQYSDGGGNGGGGDDGSGDQKSDGDGSLFGGGAHDLFSHLAELRARILYSVLAVGLASCVTWNYGKQISNFLAAPILKSLQASHVKGSLITIEPMEGFYIYFQITLAAAMILAAPFVLFQMWRFIEPALTKTERRYTIFLVPFSVILFFSGVTLGYLMSPMFFNWFLQFQPPEALANFSYGSSVALLAKMLLVFGACFQVPVITIFLNKVGIVSRNVLIEYWRHAVVLIFTIVAIITPTWDPVTLCVCATPPCLLYVLSIWLVKWL